MGMILEKRHGLEIALQREGDRIIRASVSGLIVFQGGTEYLPYFIWENNNNDKPIIMGKVFG